MEQILSITAIRIGSRSLEVVRLDGAGASSNSSSGLKQRNSMADSQAVSAANGPRLRRSVGLWDLIHDLLPALAEP
jgi:hypothetical protein